MGAKISIESVIQVFKENNYTVCDTSNYKHLHSYLTVKCPAGHSYKVKAYSFLYGRRCRACSGCIKFSYENVKNEFKKYNFQLLDLEYNDIKSKLEVICPNGHNLQISFSQFKQHHSCKICNKKDKYKYEFVKSHIESHGYQLISVNYINKDSKLALICPKKHEFEISFGHFMRGTRCAYCSGNKVNYEIVRERVESQNYKLISEDYLRAAKKLIMECPKGHRCNISWSNFRNGNRCQFCYESRRRMSTEEFIFKSKELYGEKLDYSEVNYQSCNKYITLICKTHGRYKQMPQNHFKSMGCKQCYSQSLCKSNEKFIEEAKSKHNSKYDYSFCKYIKNNIKVTVICPTHGAYYQTPQDHLKGNGCNRCSLSKGELQIMQFLQQNNIAYSTQHIFPECKNINCLPFDFYLPEYNLCVEFQGIDHYQLIERSKSYEKNLKNHQSRLKNDQIKRNFCVNYSIDFLEIPYWSYDQIPKILSDKLSLPLFTQSDV